MWDFGRLAVFLLVLLRMTGFAVTAPWLGLRAVPGPVRVGLGFALAVMVYPGVTAPPVDLAAGVWPLALAAAAEVATGLAMGLICALALNALRLAGHLMDLQMGYALAELFDPVFGTRGTILSEFLYLLGLVCVLGTDVHHQAILGLARSFEFVPVAAAGVQGGLVELVVRSFAGMFLMAVQIAAPLLAVLIVVDLVLGFLTRTVPQINVFILGFPVKVAVGILMVALLLPVLGGLLGRLGAQMLRDFDTLLRVLG